MRCGAGLDVALASIDSVTELHNESESESKVATSSGGANLTDAEGNASREVFAEGLASGFFCAAESQQCSWWRPCCGSLQCESLLGGSGHVCVDKHPQCVQENGVCGGPGQLTQRCCGNMQCKQLLGGQMRCGAGLVVALASADSATDLHNESESESKIATSSGAANLTGAGRNASDTVSVAGLAYLVEEMPQCVPESGICGGPGQLTQRCCDNMQCQQLFGGSQMRCQSSQPQCVPESGICGGPGQLTQRCCGNTQCKRLLGGVDMKCLL